MEALPVEILIGIYIGVLTGIIPALISWGLGFAFKYFTGVTIPGFGVMAVAVALAGVNGGLLALADDSIVQSANAPTLVTAILVVSGAALYAHAKGDQMGANVPKRFSLKNFHERSLSPEVIDLIGRRGEIAIGVAGDVTDMVGYPPLPEDLRTEMSEAEYQFPSELAVAELERRFAGRLRTEFDVGEVSVSIDERGQASVVAAPPFSGLSKRVPSDRFAVSVNGLLPTGLARGDEVTLFVSGDRVEGTVVSARSDEGKSRSVATRSSDPTPPSTAATGGEPESVARPARAPTTIGGNGRLTVTATDEDAESIVRADRARIAVQPRGKQLEYELVSLFRRCGREFRKLTVRPGGVLDGTTPAAAKVREQYGVAVLAVRDEDGWQFGPSDTTTLTPDDELFAVGRRSDLDVFAEAVA